MTNKQIIIAVVALVLLLVAFIKAKEYIESRPEEASHDMPLK